MFEIGKTSRVVRAELTIRLRSNVLHQLLKAEGWSGGCCVLWRRVKRRVHGAKKVHSEGFSGRCLRKPPRELMSKVRERNSCGERSSHHRVLLQENGGSYRRWIGLPSCQIIIQLRMFGK